MSCLDAPVQARVIENKVKKKHLGMDILRRMKGARWHKSIFYCSPKGAVED